MTLLLSAKRKNPSDPAGGRLAFFITLQIATSKYGCQHIMTASALPIIFIAQP
jgi:hypothetical protein